ncbi:MAG: hypothetical protein ABSA17_06200 [Rhabdochlamydiaceae bacterium]|jgi:hypothetical protein
MSSISPTSVSPDALRSPATVEPAKGQMACQQAKVTCDPNLLEGALDFFPEARAISEYVERFFYPIHYDKDLPEATLFFKQIVVENESIFSKLTVKDKAQLLFDQYVKMLLPIIEESPNFSDPFSQLQARLTMLNARLPEGKTLLTFIRTMMEKDIKARHSGFSEIAICRCLGVDYKDISISGESSPIVNELLNSLYISFSVNQMFQRLIAR